VQQALAALLTDRLRLVRGLKLNTLSGDSLKKAFATAKELASNKGAPPILEEPNGYRHDGEHAHLLRKESLSRNSLFRQPPAPSIALASLPSQASVRNSKFACIDTAGEIISSSATDTLSALPHRIVHRARLLAKLVECYEVTITTLRSGLPSHDLSSVHIVWSSQDYGIFGPVQDSSGVVVPSS
jgi:hypothetical protein